MESRKDKWHIWTRKGHEREQLKDMLRLSMAEKLEWLENTEILLRKLLSQKQKTDR